MTTRAAAAADHPPGHRVGGDLAAGPDGAAVRAGHARGEDRRGDVHQRGPGPGRDPQLQRRRLRLALPEVQGRPAQDVHAARAPGDQEDRQVQAGRARPAVLDLEPGQAGRLPGRRGGGRRHQPRGPAGPAPRGGRLVSTREDLEDLPRPRLRGQEGPGRAPLRDRRRRGHTRGRRARSRLLHGRVRAAQPAAPPRAGSGPSAAAGTRTPTANRGRRRRATYTRPHGVRHLFAAYDLAKDQLYGHIKTTKNRIEVPGVLPLPALAAPARGAHRDRAATTSPRT